MNQTRVSLYPSLVFLGLNLSLDPRNVLAFYQLLALLSVEFAQVCVRCVCGCGCGCGCVSVSVGVWVCECVSVWERKRVFCERLSE